MAGNKKEIYLTKEGLEELKEELNVLKKDKRPEVVNSIKEAKELGDLSENAEYHAAREEQAVLEGRIKDLEFMISNSTIIEEKSTDKIRIGSTVEIRYIEDEDVDTYKIVGSIEADPFENKVSNESPLAKAILGKKVGMVATVDSPNGKYDIEILEVK
jgi:transcription elongation factor GreA